MREIRGDSILQLALNRFANVEKLWKRELHGSAGRKKSVSDNFQAFHRALHERWRAARNEPCQFHLRQRGNFGKSAERERESCVIKCECGMRFRFGGIIQKYFVGDDSHFAFGAK